MTCTNPFLEADGYCTVCGTVHKTTKRKSVPTYDRTRPVVKAQPHEQTPSKATTVSDIIGNVDPEPSNGKDYVVWATKKLMQHYGYEYDIRIGRGAATYFKLWYDRSHTPVVTFGVKQIDFYMTFTYQEYHEYPSIRWLLAGQTINGKAALRQIVLHEFAHAMVYFREQTTRGSHHNSDFIAAYREVMASGII